MRWAREVLVVELGKSWRRGAVNSLPIASQYIRATVVFSVSRKELCLSWDQKIVVKRPRTAAALKLDKMMESFEPPDLIR
jgi:hypothetical protein